jgi:glycosyltransferase involved in cell wall biosynthesis
MLPLYRKACMTLARATRDGLARNLTLVNSGFVAGKIHDTYGTSSRVVWPPVPGEFGDTPWEQRRQAIAAVGRIHPGKRWHEAVEIVEHVRRKGHDLAFTLIGHIDAVEYGGRLQALAATRPWFRFLLDLDRSQLLAELAQHRYGIHPMIDEHFGIAPAELQRSGCVTFVHNSGGPVEIVGGDRRLTFDGIEEAAEKIARVLENPELECELRGQVADRKEWFTEKRFCDSLREIVAEFVLLPVLPEDGSQPV